MSLDPETVLNVVQDILVVRYVSVAGLVILLYDHSLSFSDEVKLVWNAKFTSSKFLFLAMRYLVPCMMIVHSVQLSGLSDMHVSDKIFVGRITIVFNNWLVLLRLWILWERDQTLILCTLSLFIAAQMATFICTSIGLARMLPQIYFVPTLHLCVSTAPAKLAVMWIPGLAFESVVLMAMGWKSVSNILFTCLILTVGLQFLFALGLTNTILVFVARPSLVFVFYVVFYNNDNMSFNTQPPADIGSARSARRARRLTFR
ncbi:hypothetical protein B0H10DRAFT_2238195 [Mycena sp. CBHHK59/15]|nr:hypothetical protein B0H10DRAFT_2238195 [Mycena sp. CBHHK59/15]